MVVPHGSSGVVVLAEAKLRGETTGPAALRRALTGLFDQPGGDRIDAVVLACTHFPLVEEELAAAAPRATAFVDGKEGIARRTAWLTRDIAWPAEPGDGVAVFTRRSPQAGAYAPGLASYGLTRIEHL